MEPTILSKFLHMQYRLEQKKTEFNILADFQHGCRKGRSCETQLATNLEDIALNMDSGIQTDMLILVFKSFWCCPPPTPSHKAEILWDWGNILSWICTWLTQRNQRLVVNGKFSAPTKVLSGCLGTGNGTGSPLLLDDCQWRWWQLFLRD